MTREVEAEQGGAGTDTPWPDASGAEADGGGLYEASKEGNLEVVKLLLAVPGIDVNLEGEDGRTPLHKASERGHLEVMKVLLRAPGIDVNREDKEGVTPLCDASSA